MPQVAGLEIQLQVKRGDDIKSPDRRHGRPVQIGADCLRCGPMDLRAVGVTSITRRAVNPAVPAVSALRRIPPRDRLLVATGKNRPCASSSGHEHAAALPWTDDARPLSASMEAWSYPARQSSSAIAQMAGGKLCPPDTTLTLWPLTVAAADGATMSSALTALNDHLG